MHANPESLPSHGATWQKLASLAREAAGRMARGEDVRSGSGGPVSACGISVDDSRRVLTDEAVALLLALADERQLTERRDALLAGAVVNKSEGRAALHPLLRDFGGTACREAPEAARRSVLQTRERMREMAQRLHGGGLRGSTGAPITDIVNIGIGGSEFGARLLCDALQDRAPVELRAHFVSNLDALQVTRLLRTLRADSTLFVVSSKSFGTVETLINARTLRGWFDGHGLNVEDHWYAVTGKPKAAESIGIPAANVLDVPEWVGGRFSAWGAVGLPAALTLGWPVYEQWLRGGAAADEHFATAPVRDNLPMRFALDNVWHATFLGCQTHCIAAYDDRLAQFTTWAQQLEMESNGKSVSEDGVALDYDTAPVVWGGLGNNGQHTYFQLLREGTLPKAITLIGCRSASSAYPEHAAELNAHLNAQADALSRRGSARGYNSLGMLMLDDLDPFHLGALMATLEHATACAGWLWGINSFDQPGVELGKKLAGEVRRGAAR
jgi:glucose-6-phosphate isomerase